MKLFQNALLLLALLTSAARADLSSDIRTILQDKYLNKVDIGIAVTRLGASPTEADQPIYRFDSEIPLIPASNLKLITTSAFLDHFGPDFKFHTVLLANNEDLFLVGDGDPAFGDVEMLKKSGWNSTTVFRAWAEQLKSRGLTSVRNVYVDDSVFDEQFAHPNWLARYANARYSAQVAGVNLNANCVDFHLRATSPGELVSFTIEPSTSYVSVRNQAITSRNNAVGVYRLPNRNDLLLRGQIDATLGEPISVTIHDPALYAATVFAETLAAAGVATEGEIARDRTARNRFAHDPTGWTILAALDTKLPTILARANKDSMNLYAEAMCKRLGFATSGQSGSWANGAAAMGSFLQRIGVPPTQFKLDDGCGLSRENALSAEALVKVLSHNFRSPNRELFMSSLAVAGADGTFEKRFRNNLKGRVFGKSGYVAGVSAISGYLKAQNDRWYAFSILMNNCPEGTNNRAKEIQERILAAIDENAR